MYIYISLYISLSLSVCVHIYVDDCRCIYASQLIFLCRASNIANVVQADLLPSSQVRGLWWPPLGWPCGVNLWACDAEISTTAGVNPPPGRIFPMERQIPRCIRVCAIAVLEMVKQQKKAHPTSLLFKSPLNILLYFPFHIRFLFKNSESPFHRTNPRENTINGW